MMTAEKDLFLWNKNDKWWDYDEKGNVVLTLSAPEEAKKSFEKYKKKLAEKEA